MKERGGVMECAGRREKLSSTEARCAHVGEGVAGSWAVCLAISRGLRHSFAHIALGEAQGDALLGEAQVGGELGGLHKRWRLDGEACGTFGTFRTSCRVCAGVAAGARLWTSQPLFHFCNARLDCNGSTASKPVDQAQPV